MIVQACMPGDSNLKQLPIDDAMLKHFTTGKKNVSTIAKFAELSSSDKRALLRDVDDAEFSAITKVAGMYPSIKIIKAEYSVYGEPMILPGSLVTLSVKFRMLYNNVVPENATDEIMDPEEEKKLKAWYNATDLPPAHAPYYPGEKVPVVYVMLANAGIGRLICLQKTSGDECTARLQFQAPPQAGSWTFQVYVKSDTFFGIDEHFDAQVSFPFISACCATC